MKKALFALFAAMLLVAGCETGPKDYTWRGITFTYPSSYKINEEDEEEDLMRLLLSKDDDNFLIVDIMEVDPETLAEMSDEDIRNAIESEAYDLYMMDVEDENMTVPETPDVLRSHEDSVPGIVVAYEGEHYGDPYMCRISIVLLNNFEVTVKGEVNNEKDLDELIDIITSVRESSDTGSSNR